MNGVCGTHTHSLRCIATPGLQPCNAVLPNLCLTFFSATSCCIAREPCNAANSSSHPQPQPTPDETKRSGTQNWARQSEEPSVARTGALCDHGAGGSKVRQSIAAVSLVVRDYDEAIAFFTGVLHFTVVEDTPLGGGKRWVMLRPSGGGPGLLLARAANPQQEAR